MNVRHPQGVLHSFSTKNNFYDKMDLFNLIKLPSQDPIPQNFKQEIINPFLNTSSSVASIFENPLKDIKDPDYKVTENERSEDSEAEESQYEEEGERRIMILREVLIFHLFLAYE